MLDLSEPLMTDYCVFCHISNGVESASVVAQNEHAMAFVDLKQYHPGHTLVIPRKHVPDVRGLDYKAGADLMAMVAAVTAAVGQAFPNQGLSLWHSIGGGLHSRRFRICIFTFTRGTWEMTSSGCILRNQRKRVGPLLKSTQHPFTLTYRMNALAPNLLFQPTVLALRARPAAEA